MENIHCTLYLQVDGLLFHCNFNTVTVLEFINIKLGNKGDSVLQSGLGFCAFLSRPSSLIIIFPQSSF